MSDITVSSDINTFMQSANKAAAKQNLDLEDSDIKTAYENNPDTNAFTNAEKTKLSGIATGAEVNAVDSVNTQTGSVTLDADDIEDTSTTHKFATAAQLTKVDGVESGATADQTGSEIKSAYEAEANTNAYTDAEKTKLSGIETGATADQDLSSYQLQPSEGAFANGDKTKLDAIESGADVTDATNVNAAGATMNTDTDVSGNSYVLDEDNMASNDATKVPTQQSVKAYVDANSSSGDATSIQGTNVDSSVGSPSDGDILVYRSAGTDFVLESKPAAGSNPSAADITDATADGIALITSSDANPFTDADESKLDGISAGAEVNAVDSVNTQTGAVVLDADDISDAATTNKFTTASDISKLAGIEASATVDQTGAEIKTAYESESDTNAFTDAEKTKLSGIETGATADQDLSSYQLQPSEGAFANGDKTKLDGIEALADVTDATNVTSAGALMDSEVTNLAQVKAFSSADYATASQGTLAAAALPKTGGAMTGAITTNSTFDGRDVATDGTKLDSINVSAITANTAKTTNATHTGEVTGSGALTVSATAVTGKTLVTAVGADHVLIADASDSGSLKKALISDFASAGGDMAASTYDPNTVAEQLAGLTATQTLTNKTLNTAANTITVVAADVSDFNTEVGNNSAVTANTAKLTANATNVTAAGALMDSEVTNLAQVKAFASTDYATAAQGTKADSAQQPPSEGAFINGDKTKLNGIAAGAEVNVNADWNSSSGDSQINNKPTLGTAAATASSDYATAAQGATADSALQSGDNISVLTNNSGYLTAESDTLDSVTGRGATTTNGVTVGSIDINGEIQEKAVNTTGVTGSTALDPANGTIQRLTFSGNVTFTDSLVDGESITLSIDDGSGSTATWPTMEWVGGSAPTLDTTNEHIIVVWKVNSTLYGMASGVAS